MKSRMAKLGVALTLALAAMANVAHAQAYPSKPIKFIVPYSAGGLPDTVARIVGQKLSNTMGQSVVVDNKAGGSGAVAANALAQTPADGYTFIVTDGPMLATAGVLQKKPPFDAAKDFIPVSLVGIAPLYLAVNPKIKANNLDELVAHIKTNPGTLNYGSSGIGSIHHLTAEAMKSGLGLTITHIPFKGSSMSVPSMVGGDVDMTFASPPSLMGFVRNGQAKLIAINSVKRSAATPDIPALAEKIPGFDFAFNVVVLAKPGTPDEAVKKLSAEIAKAVRAPEVAEQLQKAGLDAVGGTPEQAQSAMASEGKRITQAAKVANLKQE